MNMCMIQIAVFFIIRCQMCHLHRFQKKEAATEIWYFPVSEVKVTLVDDSTGETTDYAYVYNTADKEYEALQRGDVRR